MNLGFEEWIGGSSKQKQEKVAAPESEWGADWSDSDFEDDPENVASGQGDNETQPPPKKEEEKRFLPQGGDGAAVAVASHVYSEGKEQVKKRRKVTIKIINESSATLVEPQWDFEDGKTVILPELTIESKGKAEAVFQGRTLKGCLSYEIIESTTLASAEKYRLLIVFKVLRIRASSIPFGKKLLPGRKNQAGVKVVKETEIAGKKECAVFTSNASALKHRIRRYHTYPDSDPSKVKIKPPLIFRYSISDTGEAEVKVIVKDA